MPLKIANKKHKYPGRQTKQSIVANITWFGVRSIVVKFWTLTYKVRLKQLIREKQTEYGYEIREVETQSEHVFTCS